MAVAGSDVVKGDISLNQMISASPVAAVITDPNLPDNPIITCNEAFEILTGYCEDEILGRNCRFLAGRDTEPGLTEKIKAGVRDRRPVLVEILNYKKDGTPFRNAVLVAPIFDDAGNLAYFLGSQMEVGVDPQTSPSQRSSTAKEQVAQLSLRQRQVLITMAAGKLNKQIAHELGISERTVKMHRAAVLEALNVKSSADAIRIAVQAGY